MTDPHHIALVVVDDFQSLDLFGPLDAFDAANQIGGAFYRIDVAGVTKRPVTTEAGIRVSPTVSLRTLDPVDTLVLCGGRGARVGPLTTSQRTAIAEAARSAGRVVSICTGAFLLARAGLAKGRRITTHWRYAAELEQRFPDIRVDGDALFVSDDPIWSSAGVTAGIDLSLALISEDRGRPTAAAVARQLVMYLHRTGNQAQYSDPLRAQNRADDRFADLVEWITNHLDKNMTIERLAERVSLTPRHFTRVFRERFGVTPGRYVEHLRLDRARALLDQGNARIEQVAAAVGYASDVAFRRAFERQFEMTPTQYRHRFRPSPVGTTSV
ncbi:MAG: GlxA family transcriptional regulator [Wenzhouxiangellaceae bacterium]